MIPAASRFPRARRRAAVLWTPASNARGASSSRTTSSRASGPGRRLSGARTLEAPALSDPVWQFVPWLELARREMAAGRLPALEPVSGRRRAAARQFRCPRWAPRSLWPALAFGVRPGGTCLFSFAPSSRRPPRSCGSGIAGGRAPAAGLGALAFALSCSFHRVARAPSDTLGGGRSPPAALRRPAAGGTAHATRFRGPRRSRHSSFSRGGHPETALMAALLAAAYAAFRGGRSPRSVGQPPGRSSRAALWRLRCCCPFSSTTPPAPRGCGERTTSFRPVRSSPSAVSSCPTTRTRIRSRRLRPCPSRFCVLVPFGLRGLRRDSERAVLGGARP